MAEEQLECCVRGAFHGVYTHIARAVRKPRARTPPSAPTSPKRDLRSARPKHAAINHRKTGLYRVHSGRRANGGVQMCLRAAPSQRCITSPWIAIGNI